MVEQAVQVSAGWPRLVSLKVDEQLARSQTLGTCVDKQLLQSGRDMFQSRGL